MKIGYVYIIKSPNCKRFYIGSTTNPENRLTAHNDGKVPATRHKGPWRICLLQEYPNSKIARVVEYKLKKFKSKVIIKRIIAEGIIKLKP